MVKPIDSRDVLDADYRVTAAFTGRIVGHFRPLGADAWSDYEYVAEDEGTIEVRAGIAVQREAGLPAIRMRWHGRVIRVACGEADGDEAARNAFLVAHLAPCAGAGGLGAAAVIARKLTGGSEPSMND